MSKQTTNYEHLDYITVTQTEFVECFNSGLRGVHTFGFFRKSFFFNISSIVCVFIPKFEKSRNLVIQRRVTLYVISCKLKPNYLGT